MTPPNLLVHDDAMDGGVSDTKSKSDDYFLLLILIPVPWRFLRRNLPFQRLCAKGA